MMPRLAQPELPIGVPALSTKTDPKKRRQRKVTNRCRVVLIFGTSSVFGPICFHRVWFTIFCRLAGFFWLAGRILLAFLVRVSGTISGASFWHQVAPKYKDYYSTSNFWSQFWAPVLVPKNGTQNRTVFCSNFRSHFNPILNKVCI